MRYPVLLIYFCLLTPAYAGAKDTVLIRAGMYSPFFRDQGEADTSIASLYIDKYPVTNREYLEFTKRNPEWQRSKVKSVFSDSTYLEHWNGDGAYDAPLSEQPVTNISWFAARKYCESKNARLLTTAEWEYAADSQNPKNLRLILDWYGRPGGPTTVQRAPRNSLGLVGMHGLIWEWVEDFNSSIVAGDSRSSNETSRTLFCGSGSLKAKDATQYATFMRFAHRGSLRATSVGRLLGFRCAHSPQ